MAIEEPEHKLTSYVHMVYIWGAALYTSSAQQMCLSVTCSSAFLYTVYQLNVFWYQVYQARLSVPRRWFCCCWLVENCNSHCGICNCSIFVVRFFMSLLVLQSSWRGRESWLLCLICLPCVSLLLWGSFLWCHRLVSDCGISWSCSLTIFDTACENMRLSSRLDMHSCSQARIRNGYNQVPHLSQDTKWESNKMINKS